MLTMHARRGRFQLRHRRTTGRVLGLVALGAAVWFLFIATMLAQSGDAAVVVPAMVGLGLGLAGKRAITGGALILDVQAGGTRVAALSRVLQAGELTRVEVRVPADRMVQIVFVLAGQPTPVPVTEPLRCRDVDAVAQQLAAALKVPVEVA